MTTALAPVLALPRPRPAAEDLPLDPAQPRHQVAHPLALGEGRYMATCSCHWGVTLD